MDLAALRETIDTTLFVDTHEHLLEEQTRLQGAATQRSVPCTDAALLFHHYANDDLHAAGMTPAMRSRFYAPDSGPDEKWSLLAPFYARCRHTGYLQAVRWTARLLFGEDEFDAASFARISQAMQAHAQPGFYRSVLRRAGVECCQVNSFEAIFCESTQPDLLLQDLSIAALAHDPDPEAFRQRTGIVARTLDEYHALIDGYFERYGARAVAVKSQAAYERRLNYDDVPAAVAAPLFLRHASGETLTPPERKALQDHLMRHCLRRATEHGLPVKLHCGYYAGNDGMPLERVRQNAADLCPLLVDFPETTFVLMHIGYPYQDEYIALAKHYANVHIDLCWAWIINPLAAARFVREFLVAAPASKLFTFGGDYENVETIVGHAQVARLGLAQALGELVQTGWIARGAALDLVEPLMRGNALRIFPVDRLRDNARVQRVAAG
jgi:predicted TIM-barrel fold metal-dependent hydrolase